MLLMAASMAVHGCTCAGGKRKGATAENTAYSPNLTPKVSIASSSTAASRTMDGVDRKYYTADSAYYGANFICSTWSSGFIAGYAAADSHDPSGIVSYFPAVDEAALAMTNTEIETDLLDYTIVISPTHDATDCSEPGNAAAPICAASQLYSIDVKWRGQQKTWIIQPADGVIMSDVEDIAIQHGADGQQSYALVLSAGRHNHDPRNGDEVSRGFIRVPIPSFDAMPTSADSATEATCGAELTFPDEATSRNIMASAIDPATGRWYMIDDLTRENSTEFKDPVVYFLTKSQVDACDGELQKLGSLPVAHWLLLHIVTLTDSDQKTAYMTQVLDFIATPDANGDIPADHPNAALRRKIEGFFGLSRSQMAEQARMANDFESNSLEETYRNAGEMPRILKSLMVTGMAFNHDGSKFALSTFGGDVVAWEVGIRLDQGIPAAKVFMQEFLHAPILADSRIADMNDEISGISYYLNEDPASTAAVERLILSTEKNLDNMVDLSEQDDFSGGGAIYLFSCAD
jgi:hypothetical protein